MSESVMTYVAPSTVPNAMMNLPLDATDPVMDSDHRELVEVLEGLELVCKDPVTPDCRCDRCPEGKAAACHGLLRELGSKMQILLLDHFQRENELMGRLPGTTAAKLHCIRHRRVHVNFSTQYNLAVARLDAWQPAIGAKELEKLVFEWIRSHTLEYDAELAALLRHSRV